MVVKDNDNKQEWKVYGKYSRRRVMKAMHWNSGQRKMKKKKIFVMKTTSRRDEINRKLKEDISKNACKNEFLQQQQQPKNQSNEWFVAFEEMLLSSKYFHCTTIKLKCVASMLLCQLSFRFCVMSSYKSHVTFSLSLQGVSLWLEHSIFSISSFVLNGVSFNKPNPNIYNGIHIDDYMLYVDLLEK